MLDASYEKKRIKELKALGFTSEETKEYMERLKKKLSKQVPQQYSIDTTSSCLSGGEIALLFIVLALILVTIVIYTKWGSVGVMFLFGIPCLLLIPTKKGVEDMAVGAGVYTLWKNKDRIIAKADRWLDD
jgi:hypothetical protein